MPSIEDWMNRPLDIIQGMFDHSNKEWSKPVLEYFQRRVSDKNALEWIPSLNSCQLHQLKPDCLVRFRCMVQDTYNPEFYLGVYEVQDKNTGVKTLKSGKYQDMAVCLPHQKINTESPSNVTLDRQTLYCVPVPGETEWVKQAYAERCQHQSVPSTSTPGSRVKRALEEDEPQATSSHNAAVSAGGDAMETNKETKETDKRTRTETEENAQGSTTAAEPDLNFPLPGEKGPACLVKVYDAIDDFKVNEMVEFIGVLSVDPGLASFSNGASAVGEPEDVMEGIEDEEESAHSPPPSLVPRLHVLLSQRLQHVNPLLPSDLASNDTKPFVDSVLQEAGVVRDQLRLLLQQLCLGDAFAADYLLLHLISCVYARRDITALGKFTLNLSGCPALPEFTPFLYSQLQQLVSKTHLFPLSLQNMNSALLSPKKDYAANRLKSGALQLTERTHLVLDETAMEPGQLDPTGVQNLTALGNLITWQKVEYDFNFHKTDFPANVTVLVLSEGKSLLPRDIQVTLQPRLDISSGLTDIQNTIQRYFIAGTVNLERIRKFLGAMQFLEYTLSDDIQKIVEQDFVEARKGDQTRMTQEDFHSLLVVARLLSLSTGQTLLTREVWERAKRMETERKSRLKASAAASTTSS